MPLPCPWEVFSGQGHGSLIFWAMPFKFSEKLKSYEYRHWWKFGVDISNHFWVIKNQPKFFTSLRTQLYIFDIQRYKMYSWRSKEGDRFWLIFNYSKVVWDINTKFSPVSVLIRFQLFTKFERHSLKNEAAMPLTIKNFSRAWQGHFLSQALQTWQICFFFVDVQMILLSYLDTSDCLEIEKNEKAFHSSCSGLLE